jgi:hypothetical protein
MLIDSTSVKAEGDGDWLAKQHGPSKPRDWRKVHLWIDAVTLEIWASEITGSRIGDMPVLPDLLGRIPRGQPLGMVIAIGAYDTRACHAAIAALGAAAVIPPSRNGKPWKEHTAGAMTRNETLRSCHRLDRPSGNAGPAITDEGWSRQRCASSSCWSSASCHATSTGRSPSFRSRRRY